MQRVRRRSVLKVAKSRVATGQHYRHRETVYPTEGRSTRDAVTIGAPAVMRNPVNMSSVTFYDVVHGSSGPTADLNGIRITP